MKIAVVGYGVVGFATGHMLEVFEHEINPYDTQRVGIPTPDHVEGDIAFICTPEAAVPKAIDNLVMQKFQGLIVIRSTVTPGTTDRMIAIYQRPIVHNPEFLREKYSLEDALEPRFVAIGTHDSKAAETMTMLYSQLRTSLHVMKPIDSEMLKFWGNARLSASISFGNEMLRLCEKAGANGHLINNIIARHPLYSDHPWYVGHKFDGKCLPKDLNHLIDWANEQQVDTPLLKAVRRVNEN